MSLPDSAEYWWDVKGYNKTYQPRYLHLTGRPCGKENGGGETDNLNTVSCRHCRKTERFKELDAIENPKCSCGSVMVVRTNKSNGKKFLGCSNYPKCKNTKPVTE